MNSQLSKSSAEAGSGMIPPTRTGAAVHFQPEAVNVATACRVAGISRPTLYEAMSSGGLPSLKIGKRRLIRLEALRAWLASLERQAA